MDWHKIECRHLWFSDDTSSYSNSSIYSMCYVVVFFLETGLASFFKGNYIKNNFQLFYFTTKLLQTKLDLMLQLHFDVSCKHVLCLQLAWL